MTGRNAGTPGGPPLGCFTELEQYALQCVALSFGQEADTFREQLVSAVVVDRVNTTAGFFTRVKVDRTKCSPVSFSNRGAHIQVDEIRHGLGIALWDLDGDGYLETIEGFTYEEKLPSDVALSDLMPRRT